MNKVKDWFILFFKGMIMGIANIIPGVSGGTLAVILGVFKDFVEAIGNVFKHFWKSVFFLLPIVLGMGVAILVSSKGIEFCLKNYALATCLFFVGLILGGIPILFKKIDKHLKEVPNYLIFALIFAFVLIITFVLNGGGSKSFESLKFFDYILLFIAGVLAASSMVVPGISGSMVLMTMGYYEGILETIGNLVDFSLLSHNLLILVPFGLGAVIGLLLISKLISYLLRRFEVKTYFGIFGFIFSSLIVIFIKNEISFGIVEFLIGLVLMVLGFALSYFIASKNKGDGNLENEKEICNSN